MKFPSLILLAVIAIVYGDQEDEVREPTMAFVHHITLSDSKICGDGETIQISCGLNIMERLDTPFLTLAEEQAIEKAERDAEKEAEKAAKEAEKAAKEAEEAAAAAAAGTAAPSNLRRRLPKEDDEPVEPAELPPLFTSDVYEMEITNCTQSIKGQNQALYLPGKQLIVEAEGYQNIDVASADPYNNTESIMTRQGRIKFWEPPTEWQQLMGYNKSNHVGNLLFKVIVERKQVIDQNEMFLGMTLTMQAMADAIMLNDTGVMFPDPVPAFKNYTRVISAELDWEHIVNVACSPEKFATAAPTPQPSPQPSQNPTAPSVAPSMVPSVTPSVSDMPSDMPSSTPTPAPSSLPSTMPSDMPSSVPSPSPSDLPSSMPSGGPTAMPSPLPSPLPTSMPSLAPSTTVLPSASPSGDLFRNNAFPEDLTADSTPSRGPSTQQFVSQFDGPMNQDDLSEYTREYYGETGEVHDQEKPDLITP
ncbi:MAG: hypothetical protein SGBAC_007534 [Bacillariaceae sp.]